MRFLAVSLVLFSCATGGFLVAASFGQRVSNLRELLSFIQLLESEIHFAHTTLPQIINKQIPHYQGVVKEFLQVLATNLKQDASCEFAAIWEQGIILLGKNGFPNQTLVDLRDLGKVLGLADVSEQLKHLRLCTVRLGQSLEEAKNEQQKQERLWRYLGISTGLLLVLLFI